MRSRYCARNVRGPPPSRYGPRFGGWWVRYEGETLGDVLRRPRVRRSHDAPAADRARAKRVHARRRPASGNRRCLLGARALHRLGCMIDSARARRSSRRTWGDDRRTARSHRGPASSAALQRSRAARRAARSWRKRWPAVPWPRRSTAILNAFSLRRICCRATSSGHVYSIRGRAPLPPFWGQFSPTSCWRMKSIARRPKCSPRFSRRCRSVRSRLGHNRTPSPIRSS